MKSISNFNLKTRNTFAFDSIAPIIYFPSELSHLSQLASELKNRSYYLLGEGSNTLFFESKSPVIVAPEFKGVDITEQADGYQVVVGANENWHQLVEHLVGQGILGLENLALIPGSVGAAPVQNIGAYGKDISGYCQSVQWYCLQTNTLKQLSNAQCQFGYRDSAFKHTPYNKGIITQVTFYFPKAWQAELSYGDLKSLPGNASALAIMAKVIEIRASKLPEPDKLPNAGSFFKNPVVDKAVVDRLASQYEGMPVYPVDEQQSKLAAGWLIDKAGLKGLTRNGVGIHEHQALVLVNYHAKQGRVIIELAKFIQQTVLEQFGVIIEPEVRLVGESGEQRFSDIAIGEIC